jgi:hypothetical protein
MAASSSVGLWGRGGVKETEKEKKLIKVKKSNL